ncbi:MAG: N-acetylglucosamine-6-phosphate deacetylase [Dehalococcoidia bacterium]
MENLLIRNGVCALEAGPRRADILCVDARIVAMGHEVEAAGVPVLDASGLTIGPGFVDIHTHGGGGSSFFAAETEQVYSFSEWAPRHGVTSFLVSTSGRGAGGTEEILSRLAPAVIVPPAGAEPLGFHVEGPFLNPVRRGAFEEAMLERPSADAFGRFQAAAFGLIRQITLAPELPGAADVIQAALHTGAAAAMGHTDATAEQARRGFSAGITHVTHLFNAMRPVHQRDGGPVLAALLEGGLTCELICDGAHLAEEVLQAAYRILGPARTCVVTDNVALAGAGAGVGPAAGSLATHTGAAVRADGTITGSITPMDQQFRNAIAFLGLDLATAFRICCSNPARVAGAAGRKGRLERGMDADLVLLDDALRVVATVCRGQVAWDARSGGSGVAR